MLKRLATTTMLGLAMVAASVQQAAAATVICWDAQYEGTFIDRYGNVTEYWSCSSIWIIS